MTTIPSPEAQKLPDLATLLISDLKPEKKEMYETVFRFLGILRGHNGTFWWKAFKRFLKQEHPFLKTTEDVWKKIVIHNQTAEEIFAFVENQKFYIYDQVKALFLFTQTGPREREEVELVMGTTNELFGDTLTRPLEFLDELFLAQFGLMLCKPEDAFYIRADYPNQPPGESIQVGTFPQVGEDGKRYLYNVMEYVPHHQYYPRPSISISEIHEGCSCVGGRWAFRRKQ